jgi:hypothetical protein
MSSPQIMTMLGFLSSACAENTAAQALNAISAIVAGRCSRFLVIKVFLLSWLIRKWISYINSILSNYNNNQKSLIWDFRAVCRVTGG